MLTKVISQTAWIPIVVSGRSSRNDGVAKLIQESSIDVVANVSLLHYELSTDKDLKLAMDEGGVEVQLWAVLSS